jgi:hypothetical protein
VSTHETDINVVDVYLEPRGNGTEYVVTFKLDKKADIEGVPVEFIGVTLTEALAVKMKNMIMGHLARKVMVSLPGMPQSPARLI